MFSSRPRGADRDPGIHAAVDAGERPCGASQEAQLAQAKTWSLQYDRTYAAYQAKIQAEAVAAAEATRIAAPQQPPAAARLHRQDHQRRLQPLGPAAVQWAVNVATASRGTPELGEQLERGVGPLQFLPSTWPSRPGMRSLHSTRSPTPSGAWLYKRDGPNQWVCRADLSSSAAECGVTFGDYNNLQLIDRLLLGSALEEHRLVVDDRHAIRQRGLGRL